jgi:lysophospholipase L1-like esterase
MRETLIKKASSSFVAGIAILFLLIFIVAMKRPLQKKAYTYLALGDSYTIGEKVPSEENFPNQVVSILRMKGFDFATPRIVARTGWTTEELQLGINKSKLAKHYDFVSLLIGVNNQYRGREASDYIQEFEFVLKQALKFAGNNPRRLIVLSIPDWSSTPFCKGEDRQKVALQIDEYNKINKQVANKYRVHYINITPGTRQAANDTELLAEDGLHPSGKEYKKWAVDVAAIIKSEL